MLKGQGDAYEGKMGISRIGMRSKFILQIKYGVVKNEKSHFSGIDVLITY
jgi:hypothetical protein